MQSVLERTTSTQDDRLALVLNVSTVKSGAEDDHHGDVENTGSNIETTLRHFLRGVMIRHADCIVGQEPVISSLRLLTASELNKYATVAVASSPGTTAALVEFSTSRDCEIGLSMLHDQSDKLHFHGNPMSITKVTGVSHVDHADRNDAIRSSMNKRFEPINSSVPPPATAPANPGGEVKELQQALNQERQALKETREALLKEQALRISSSENEEQHMLVLSTTKDILHRTKQALQMEAKEKEHLRAKIHQLEQALQRSREEGEKQSSSAAMDSPTASISERSD